jgi:RNA polymerase sigma-70 factor, ECF subfamily
MNPTVALDAAPSDIAWATTLERLRAFVAKRVGDPETAADITQDVIVRSIAAGALERVDDPIAWLYRSARNAIVDHYRTRRAHLPLDADDDRWLDANDDDSNAATRELSRCLEPLLDRLPATARDALVRVEIDGQTQHQAAREAGVSDSGMKSRVQRGRRALRELIEQCCLVELDRRGAIMDYRPNTDAACDCDAPCERDRPSAR